MRADGTNQETLAAIPRVAFGVQARHLYIHVPFCARRCVYCDFSIAVRARIPAREFVAAVAREWRTRFADAPFGLETVYFGGGTPSKLGAEGVAELMDVVRLHASVASAAEVTLEANPEDVTAESARGWRDVGINRVSLGVQSFDDHVLAWMHRTHDAHGARRAIERLRDAGIENISIDLIFAVPGNLERAFDSDLATAIALELPHVSVYGLTVEPRTPLGRWVARKDISESPEDVFEREFLGGHDALTAAGLEHYEVSNYGRPGMHSRHNWAYWRREPYIGLGPSAHEFDGARRRWNTAPYVAWLDLVSRGSDPVAGTEKLSDTDARSEDIYLSLRTRTGLVLTESEQEHVAPWIEAGWAILDQTSRFRLTELGWLRLDALANDLTLLRSRY